MPLVVVGLSHKTAPVEVRERMAFAESDLAAAAARIRSLGLAAEALVVFRPEAVTSPERHRKRTGHLLSKQRLVAAQFLGWLSDDAWLRHAAHANSLAARLADGFVAAGHPPVHPVETNMVFLHLPHTVAAAWHAAGAEFYVLPTPDPAVGLARFVTSWSTTDPEVDELLALAGS